MSYRIEYKTGTEMARSQNSGRLFQRTVCFFLLFLLLTQLFWPAGTEKIRELLWPWNPDVSAEAFSNLVRDIRCGLSAEDAVITFCREILADANIQH